MAKIPRKPRVGKGIPKIRKTKAPRLGLRIAKLLDSLSQYEASQPQATEKSIFTIREQSILRRISDINSGAVSGFLTEADFNNLRQIAAKHRIRLR